MKPIRAGIVGVGKIACDQHIPAILGDPAFIFAAAASRHAQAKGAANFSSIEDMLARGPDLDAVAIRTPPQAHYAAAKLASAQGKHVLLEKNAISILTQIIPEPLFAVPPDPGSLDSEHQSIYERFAELIRQEESEVDARPLQLVADIFMLAKYISVEPFVP